MAGRLSGRVVGVLDGETITILDDAKRQRKVRLAGVDAPEKGQAFGERSTSTRAKKRLGERAAARQNDQLAVAAGGLSGRCSFRAAKCPCRGGTG
jgi:endonuclease YncB( thermonuclease family)